MGCILSFFDFLVEDIIIGGYFDLMQLIVPDRLFSKGLRIVLEIFTWIFSGILFLSMFFGIFLLIQDEAEAVWLGKRMVFIPLAISAVQIVLGIIVRCITKKKK